MSAKQCGDGELVASAGIGVSGGVRGVAAALRAFGGALCVAR